MGYIREELGIKSVTGLTKWFKSELIKREKTVEIDCVKVDRYIYVYWAVNNKLHKYEIPAPVVYVIKEESLDRAIEQIISSLQL